jgi:hypothetical protein
MRLIYDLCGDTRVIRINGPTRCCVTMHNDDTRVVCQIVLIVYSLNSVVSACRVGFASEPPLDIYKKLVSMVVKPGALRTCCFVSVMSSAVHTTSNTTLSLASLPTDRYEAGCSTFCIR